MNFTFRTSLAVMLEILKKYISFFFLIFILLFLLASNITFAASKTYIQTGESFQLKMKDLPKGSTVTWIISQEGTILETKTGKKLKHTFSKKGDYSIRATAESKNGEIQSSLIEVSVSSVLPNFSPLKAVITSVPKIEDGIITLSGNSDRVTFSFQKSTGSISSYALESDIFSDSNNDGIIDNDIDNKDDISYTSGTFFHKTYTNNGIPSRAILTVTNDKGAVSTQAVTIIFDEGEKKLERISKPLKAVLKTIPESDNSGNIIIPKTGGTILLFAGESQGVIKEYRIDTNLSLDSDGDGNTKNDIDNIGTDSFVDGSVFPLEIKDLTKVREISITVIDESGKKTMIQKTISPGNKNNISAGNNKLVPLLFTSRSRILEGETITFKLFNISETSSVSWDFNGDGNFELEKSDSHQVEYKYSEEGHFNVKAEIIEVGKSPIIQRKSITVFDKNEGQLKTSPPTSHFLPQISGNIVNFSSSKSTSDSNLLNTDISYSWDFGDGYKTQGPNPTHIYEKEGDYLVQLIVEDSIERTGIYTETLNISTLTESFEISQHGGIVDGEEAPEQTPELLPVDVSTLATPNPILDPSKNITEESQNNESVNDASGFSFPWWILLPLVILLAPLFFLLKKKVDNPNKNFSDIIQDIIHGGNKKNKEMDENGNIIFDEEEDNNEEEDEDQNSREDKDTYSEEDEEGEGEDDEKSKDENDHGGDEEEEETPEWMRTYEEEENEEEINGTDESTSGLESQSIDGDEIIDPVPMLENNDILDKDPSNDDVVEIEENTELNSSDPDPLGFSSPFDVDHPEWLDDVKKGDADELKINISEEPVEENNDSDIDGSIEDSKITPELENNDGEIPEWMKPSEAIVNNEKSIPSESITEEALSNSDDDLELESPLVGESKEEDLPEWMKGGEEEKLQIENQDIENSENINNESDLNSDILNVNKENIEGIDTKNLFPDILTDIENNNNNSDDFSELINDETDLSIDEENNSEIISNEIGSLENDSIQEIEKNIKSEMSEEPLIDEINSDDTITFNEEAISESNILDNIEEKNIPVIPATDAEVPEKDNTSKLPEWLK